jgi:hypothetical protein
MKRICRNEEKSAELLNDSMLIGLLSGHNQIQPEITVPCFSISHQNFNKECIEEGLESRLVFT